jgi:hypothetical protein
MVTIEDYFKAKNDYIDSTILTRQAIRKNAKAITKIIKKLYIYTGIKEKRTGSECKFKIEAMSIFKKMLENLSLDSISKIKMLENYNLILSDSISEIKMLENCNLISTVIKVIETESESNIYLTKIVILNKMLKNIDLTSTIMKLTETDSKAEAVSKTVLTKMLINLNSITTTTYKAKLAELKAKYYVDLIEDYKKILYKH